MILAPSRESACFTTRAANPQVAAPGQGRLQALRASVRWIYGLRRPPHPLLRWDLPLPGGQEVTEG